MTKAVLEDMIGVVRDQLDEASLLVLKSMATVEEQHEILVPLKGAFGLVKSIGEVFARS